MNSNLPEVDILKLTRDRIYPRGDRLEPDFLVDRRPMLDRSTPIASIGSCFASRIKRQLEGWGYTYVQTSEHPAARPGSAAWGTVFNSRCVAQEVRRARGAFNPPEKHWVTDGTLASPYRKGVTWESVEERDAELEEHEEGARRAFKAAEVLIITLGLTEIWYGPGGWTFYQVPPADVYNAGRHSFRTLRVGDIIYDLSYVEDALRLLNPDLEIVLTVSPVPLRATFQDLDAVTANTVSKARLVAAAHRVCEKWERWHYFPSFELVTTVLPDPYKGDNRHVTEETEEQVMALFEETFCK